MFFCDLQDAGNSPHSDTLSAFSHAVQLIINIDVGRTLQFTNVFIDINCEMEYVTANANY